MCKFFSLDSDGVGNIFYFNAIQRKEIKNKYEPDSHTSIADYYGFKGKLEDKLNKYEFNPLTKTFTIDQLNTTDDRELVKQKCLGLDFKEIVPELIIKPIISPFIDKQCESVSDEDIELLREWVLVWNSIEDSVEDSVRDSVEKSVVDSVGNFVGKSVWNTIWDSVWNSVRDSVWDSVRDSVWKSVRESVGDFVWNSVRESVRESVRDFVWDSVYAYISSFFKIQYSCDFASTIKLWEKGLVPSFDGTKWRLHGYKGKILWGGGI